MYIIQCVFCIDNITLLRAINSLSYLNNLKYNIIIKGYFKDDIYWNTYKKYIKSDYIVLKRSKNNVGKSRIYNNIIRKIDHNVCVFFIDSDILIPKNIMNKLLQIYHKYPTTVI